MSTPTISGSRIFILVLSIMMLAGCVTDPDLKTPAIPLQLFEKAALQKEIALLKARQDTSTTLLKVMQDAPEVTGSQSKGEEATDGDDAENDAEDNGLSSRITLLEDSLRGIEKFLARDVQPAGGLPIPPLCVKGPVCPSPCQETKDCDVVIPVWASILIQQQAGIDKVEISVTNMDGKILAISSSAEPKTFKTLSSTGYGLAKMNELSTYTGLANLQVTKYAGEEIIGKFGLGIEIGASTPPGND